MSSPDVWRVIGLMSGTSYDGIDVAAADIALDNAGEEVVLTPLGALERPHDPAVRELIAEVLPPATVLLEDVCRLDTLLGQAFADAAAHGIEELAGGRADLVVSHGQTVFHWVEHGRARGTLQLGQPAWIAERTGVPVVSDLRSRDITRGGQGAPLVSILDVLLLAPGGHAKAALNLGGIANMTVVRPDGSVLAYDLGPANALIDLACRRYFDQAYDPDGAHAAAGSVDQALLARLLDEPYYAMPPPKSTGKELFNADYLGRKLAGLPDLDPDDILATVTELTATVVANECAAHGIGELIVSGGGVRNPTLIRRIAELVDATTRPGRPGRQNGRPVAVRPIDDLGLPADAKEAYAFALLGFFTAHGIPATIPSCTGATTASILGSITPGAEPLRLPLPARRTPTRLRIQA
ncbi:MAG TPA: anhydro-N-acetylmuramic acid kinase [Actinopolymorphaceae bacterium]|jgi:anhydro-N-acetylmuramic acid kinase